MSESLEGPEKRRKISFIFSFLFFSSNLYSSIFIEFKDKYCIIEIISPAHSLRVNWLGKLRSDYTPT